MEGKFVITKLYRNLIDGYYEKIIGLHLEEDSSCIRMEIKKIEFSFQPSTQIISVSENVSYEEAKKIAIKLKCTIAPRHIENPTLQYKNKFYDL